MTPAVATRPTAFSTLLSAYVTGAVGEAVIAGFDDLFEDVDASPAERIAFARFFLDALQSGDDANAFPEPAEVVGILAAARA